MLAKNMLRQLDVQDIMVFLWLHKINSAKKTAEALNISQPSVSYRLKRLRDCFDDPLFVNSYGTLTPTPKAEAILPHLRNIVDAVNLCSKELKGASPSPEIKVFRLYAPEYFELALFPVLLDALLHAPIKASLHVERFGKDLPVDQLLTGDIHMAIGFGPGYHRLHPGLTWESLLADTFVCVIQTRESETKSQLTLDEFCGMRHVFPTPWMSEKNMVDDWLDKIGRTRMIVARANTYQACVNIVTRLPVVLALPSRLIPYLAIPDSVCIVDAPLGFPTFTLDAFWCSDNRQNDGPCDLKTLLRQSVNNLLGVTDRQ